MYSTLLRHRAVCVATARLLFSLGLLLSLCLFQEQVPGPRRCVCMFWIGGYAYNVVLLNGWGYARRNPLNKLDLNPFARSWFYNATAVRGALWWLRQSHSINYANQHPPFVRRQYDVTNSIFPGIVWQKFHENPFSRSRERLSHIFLRTEKNKKKQL